MKMAVNNTAQYVTTDGLLIGTIEAFATQGGGDKLFHGTR